MEIVLVRHTRVAVEPGICYGQSDVALADSHLGEWAEIRAALAKDRFDAVFTSPLSRCSLLARYLCDAFAIEPRLMELNFGRWEMLSWQAIYEREESRGWFDDYIHTAPPEGESYQALLDRVQTLVEELRRSGYLKVLLVTHAGVLRAAMHLLGGYTVAQAFDTSLEWGAIQRYTI